MVLCLRGHDLPDVVSHAGADVTRRGCPACAIDVARESISAALCALGSFPDGDPAVVALRAADASLAFDA